MKKLFIALSLMILSLALSGQSVEVYRSYYITFFNIDVKTQTIISKTGAPGEILLSFDIEKGILTINYDKPAKVYIANELSRTEHVDDDGDKYLEISWSCIDHNGDKVMLISHDWPDFTNRNFTVVTEKVIIEYRCRIIN